MHSYNYSPDGNLLERTENATTTSYTYPQPGEDRPHAPTHVGDGTYTWDEAGNLVERTQGAQTETLTWDTEGHLASVEGPDGVTEFVYDAAGQRLLRRTDDATTLYVAGHEITAEPSGTVRDAVRPYVFDGELIATRSITRGVEYHISDQAGSVEMSIGSGDPTVAGTRAYEPYGQVRGQDGQDFATDRGFIGQIEDATTGLSYLNARYYDTTIGLFISTDPPYDPARPKSLNPYS